MIKFYLFCIIVICYTSFFAGCKDQRQPFGVMLSYNTRVNFGKVRSTDSPVHVSLNMTNEGFDDIEILSGTVSSCTCIVPRIPQMIIAPKQTITIPVEVDVTDSRGEFCQHLTIPIKNSPGGVHVEICGTVVTDIWHNGSSIRTSVAPNTSEAAASFTLHTVDYPDIAFDWTALDAAMQIREVSRSTVAGETVITLVLTANVGDADKFCRDFIVKTTNPKVVPFSLSFYCYRE